MHALGSTKTLEIANFKFFSVLGCQNLTESESQHSLMGKQVLTNLSVYPGNQMVGLQTLIATKNSTKDYQIMSI